MEDDSELYKDANIIRHQQPTGDDSLSSGDGDLIDAVTDHFERHVATVDRVFHELVSPYVHVDVHYIPPGAGRNYRMLFTTGMAERPMAVPEGAESYRFAELMVCLPASWPVSETAFEDEEVYWPVRWLKQLARFPHEYDTWLGWGHTVPNGDPPEPFASNTGFCGALLLAPLSLPEEAWRIPVEEGREVQLYSLIPLYAEEMDFKLRRGTEALIERFEKAGVTDLIDVRRPNLLARRKFWPFG
jgi:Suppressor of fused protein (SUFU)